MEKKNAPQKTAKDIGQTFKVVERWYQDAEDSDYWHGQHRVIVNTAALNEREFYYHIIRINAEAGVPKERFNRAYA